MSVDAETLALYAAEADRYAGLTMSKVEREALAGFLDRLTPGAHILDLGCGPGIQAALMQARGFSVTAIDACPEFVELARARGVDAKLMTFDELSDEAAYDAAWASFSLLHAPRAAFPRHLAALARAVRPGGWLFLGMKTGQGEMRDHLGRFYSFFSPAELDTLSRAAGFTPVHAVEDRAAGLAGSVDPFILMTCHRA